MDPTTITTVVGLITNIAGGVIANKISDYLKNEKNPSKEGIITILSEGYGSSVSTEKVSIEADKVINIITGHGGKISLGEGSYKARNASVNIGKGGKINMNGDASIKIN